MDVKEEHVTSFGGDVLECYKIPVWVSWYEPGKAGLFTNLDENFAATLGSAQVYGHREQRPSSTRGQKRQKPRWSFGTERKGLHKASGNAS